jgi:hypothetical protein
VCMTYSFSIIGLPGGDWVRRAWWQGRWEQPDLP